MQRLEGPTFDGESFVVMLKRRRDVGDVLDDVDQLFGGKAAFLGSSHQVGVDVQGVGDHVHHVVADICVALQVKKLNLF